MVEVLDVYFMGLFKQWRCEVCGDYMISSLMALVGGPWGSGLTEWVGHVVRFFRMRLILR